MGYEIERKFLVKGDAWRAGARKVQCRQGYLAVGPPASVRVRVMGEEAHINVKQATLKIGRAEYEYAIPRTDAEEMLDRLNEGHVIEKIRHYVDHEGMTLEVDEFLGKNAGLIVAEIELDSEDQKFARPEWVGEEVSGDPRYLNSSLSRRPYCEWDAAGLGKSR